MSEAPSHGEYHTRIRPSALGNELRDYEQII